MKVLLIGVDGLLGSYWLNRIGQRCPSFEIMGTSRKKDLNKSKLYLDLSQPFLEDFKAILSDYKPDTVIYLAGLTNVDECEKEKQLSLDLNANFPAIMAKECAGFDIKFLYISTDHLFGSNGEFFNEDDATVLVNHYARTKKLAEEYIFENNPKALIIRSNFYGKSIAAKPSFTDWIENSLLNSLELKMQEDVFFTPVYMGDLVDISHLLLEKNCFGVYNVSSDERVSKYNFALLYAKYFNLNTHLIIPFKQKQFPRDVQRPTEMSLSNIKMKNVTGYKIGNILDGFEKLKFERSSI